MIDAMHRQTISTCIAYDVNEAVEKKSTSPVKTAGFPRSILLPAAAVFDVNDTGNARFPAKPGRNFLSFFSLLSPFF